MPSRRELIGTLHALTAAQRVEALKELCGLTDQEASALAGLTTPPVALAETFIENAIGWFAMPLGVATNFVIDGRDVLVPMAVEETSIIAAASATAKWVGRHGSIRTWSKGNLVIGQIQLPDVHDPKRAVRILRDHREELLERGNALLPGLVQRGGGLRDVSMRELDRPTGDGTMLVVHLLVDTCDAMGANLVNILCEALKPDVEQLTGEHVGLCILSNLVDGRLAGAEVVVRNVDRELARGIEEAALFAKADPYRAATHNKGVLNGIDPILIATGNDFRAVEAGIHAFAARSGTYQPVTEWRRDGLDLVGTIEVPLAVGTVGGVTRLHPAARVALKMLGVSGAAELARVCVAVGLVQNLGALKALATVGIVKGHMALHAANLALAAGAEGDEVQQVRDQLARVLEIEKTISLARAREILERLRDAVVEPVPDPAKT